MITQLPGIQPEIALQAIPDDERVWVPQAPLVWFRPLLLNTTLAASAALSGSNAVRCSRKPAIRRLAQA